jgi:maleate isomerase
MLVGDAVDAIGYASTTSAYAIGFDAEMAMVSRLEQLTGVPVEATCASAVRGLRALYAERVALIGAPWFEPDWNDLGAAYFRGQGFDVISSESAAELPQDPAQIEPASVYEWTARHVSDRAETVFIGGNGFRAAAAIERLEAKLSRPVLTANQVLLWSLLGHGGEPFNVSGYGGLFAHSPSMGAVDGRHG